MPKETILIADDDRITVQILSNCLRGLGYEITVAADAMQAVMYSMRNPVSAIFLDIKMPGGTGVDVLKRLKSSTKTSHLPVIIITGSSDPNLPKIVKELGAEEFIPKPMDLIKVEEIVTRLFGGSSPRTPYVCCASLRSGFFLDSFCSSANKGLFKKRSPACPRVWLHEGYSASSRRKL